MSKEQISSLEQAENELLQTMVQHGKTIAGRLQQEFGEVFYPMKFVELPNCKMAYANPGGDHPISLRMHQLNAGHAAGVEVSLFFKALPGTAGQELELFEDEKNRSNISATTAGTHTYYFINQNTDGSLATQPGSHSPDLGIDQLQTYSEFVNGLVAPLQATLVS